MSRRGSGVSDLLRRERPVLVGIVNVTPDSFSDGGSYASAQAACAHALGLVEEGADVIDIGGESTRPGSSPTATRTQLDRVLPVITTLTQRVPAHVMVSIDTRDPVVAARALEAGAGIVNDVSAGRADGMFEAVAAARAYLVLMHMQGTPATMQDNPSYEDVVAEVIAYLQERAQAAERAGVARERIIIDPGIGFGKTRSHNLQLLAQLVAFVATGYPVLLGTSRKRFMGAICEETVFTELLGATCATTALGVGAGVRMFRVHDVKPNRQAADVAWAIKQQRQSRKQQQARA